MTSSELVKLFISVSESRSRRINERTLLVAEYLLNKNREEIQRADEKVSMLVVGALTTGALFVQWAWSHVARASLTAQWLVAMGLAIWLIALVLLAVAVYPRLGAKQDVRAATYFVDMCHTTDMSTLRQYVRRAAEDRLSWLLIQVTDTSAIVVVKYRCLRVAICLLGLGGALDVIGIAL